MKNINHSDVNEDEEVKYVVMNRKQRRDHEKDVRKKIKNELRKRK